MRTTRKFLMALAWAGLLSAATTVQAQNLIVNGGFENNPPPEWGNNIGWQFTPWILGPGNQSNVVKVYGPGGFD